MTDLAKRLDACKTRVGDLVDRVSDPILDAFACSQIVLISTAEGAGPYDKNFSETLLGYMPDGCSLTSEGRQYLASQIKTVTKVNAAYLKFLELLSTELAERL